MAVSETVAGWGILLATSAVTAAVIVNGVMGNYEDSKGQSYGAGSNATSVSVVGIAAAMVLPKAKKPDAELDAAAHGTQATKTFTISNDSNITDAYLISALSVSAGSVTSVVFKPAGGPAIAATVGATVSPPVPVGGSIQVVVTVATSTAPVGSTIDVALTATTTAHSQNGPQSDTGNGFIIVARGPSISGVGNPPSATPASGASPLPVVELVDGAAVGEAEPGSSVTFTLPFTNIGDTPAIGVTARVTLPPQFTPKAGSPSVQMTDRRTGKALGASTGTNIALAGNTITATIPELDPNIDVTLAYGATVAAAAVIGTTAHNTATIDAQALTEITATPATVFLGVMNTVFDGLGGSTHPVAGATVAVVDAGTGLPARIATGGVPPNDANRNPFTTSAPGTFSFTLPATAGHAANYQLYVTAAGYLNRRIGVAVATGADGLTSTTLTAVDGLPLATAGGFGFTAGPVTVARVPGFFGNVPMFTPNTLSLTITCDRSVASAGDRLAYTVTYGPGGKPLPFPGDLRIDLPAGIAYARGTARIAAVPAEPAIGGRTLDFPVGTLNASRTLTFDAVVVPGVTEHATLTTRAILSALLAGATLSVEARVGVGIVGGPLSSRSILTGRVFTDRAKDGHFAPGDTGVAGVRIFLEDGESVLTDQDGRFSFPAARPGMHVLHLDPLTLPAGVRVYHGFPVNDSRSSMRLVHGIFDSGLMDDVNFAVTDAAR